MKEVLWIALIYAEVISGEPHLLQTVYGKFSVGFGVQCDEIVSTRREHDEFVAVVIDAFRAVGEINAARRAGHFDVPGKRREIGVIEVETITTEM